MKVSPLASVPTEQSKAPPAPPIGCPGGGGGPSGVGGVTARAIAWPATLPPLVPAPVAACCGVPAATDTLDEEEDGASAAAASPERSSPARPLRFGGCESERAAPRRKPVSRCEEQKSGGPPAAHRAAGGTVGAHQAVECLNASSLDPLEDLPHLRLRGRHARRRVGLLQRLQRPVFARRSEGGAHALAAGLSECWTEPCRCRTRKVPRGRCWPPPQKPRSRTAAVLPGSIHERVSALRPRGGQGGGQGGRGGRRGTRASCCVRVRPHPRTASVAASSLPSAESSSAFLARAARAARRGSREVLPPGSAAALSASW